jgi:catechol 2,3-dioxygenase-like lactoylglutathione lyase family enzyme
VLDHISIGVSDLDASRAFYLKALGPLDVTVVKEVPGSVGIGRRGFPTFWLSATDRAPAPLHLAFRAENREQVDAFYRTALEAGARDNGAPGLRAHYHPDYYGAFVIGPDGHNVEVVCHRAPAAAQAGR